jgi:GT2 family glycosyltransferase
MSTVPSRTSATRETPADPSPGANAASTRVTARGRFLHAGDEKLLLRGVTYGPFRPGPGGEPYAVAAAERDLARIRAAGFDTVRLYTPPPRWLLDAAGRHGLRVLGGLAWEQHVAFLDDRSRVRDVLRRVRADARAVAGHPSLLGWTIGNEIPAPVVRWHGRRRTEEFLRLLHDAVKSDDEAALVTYVNYPTTEYLDLGFLDLVCFNVFLERRTQFRAYLDRLQHLAGDRPLLLTELGLDSAANGVDEQARSLRWQVGEALSAGCAGAFVFAWTDEWHRGGEEVTGWDFGLTDRERRPKPALQAVRAAFAAAPLALPEDPPRVSVVICTYNGAATLDETCRAVGRLAYPEVEVLVVDDGSTDESAAIAQAHGFRVISTDNRGLSCARNTGAQAVAGDIVAYVDDDAAPDPHWLHHAVQALSDDGVVAAGGPNIAVPGDGLVADAVAIAPGNPSHVLLDDRVAEHIPGCNSLFRRDALLAIGGFDGRFRTAGDDVDVCWRLQERGGTIAFAPAAVVLHHRRGSVAGYLRQQRGYGAAEALLERKWPERYGTSGHIGWRGRIYAPGSASAAGRQRRWRVYHGVWNSAPFQRLYAPSDRGLDTMLLMPEAYLAIGCLTLLVGLGLAWPPLLALSPVLAVAAGLIVARATAIVARARLPTPGLSPRERAARRGLAVALHLLQPLFRLHGRLRHGLTPWRRRPHDLRALPLAREVQRWREAWADPYEDLRAVRERLVEGGVAVRVGGDFDAWDLEVAGGTLAGARIATLAEEHEQGRQMIRTRCRPTFGAAGLAVISVVAVLGAAAAASGAAVAAAVLLLAAASLGARMLAEAGAAVATLVAAVAVDPPGSDA